ncbi:MAG: hypothetical protein H6709_09045 [Kofleriaceae bacterium]|nr:hypothetical protein [Kofleriaceae bacterium]
MSWSRPIADAAALEAAIAVLDALAEAGTIARRLEADCRALGADDLATTAATLARAFDHVAAGEVEPHHAQWMGAATAWALRQAVTHAAAGYPVDAAALAGARYELETLFPIPATGVRPTRPGDGPTVPASSLVRPKPAGP